MRTCLPTRLHAVMYSAGKFLRFQFVMFYLGQNSNLFELFYFLPLLAIGNLLEMKQTVGNLGKIGSFVSKM